MNSSTSASSSLIFVGWRSFIDADADADADDDDDIALVVVVVSNVEITVDVIRNIYYCIFSLSIDIYS